MRVALMSDIHANWDAFWTALGDADEHGAEEIWFLGDLFGYGPAPVRCWQELSMFRQTRPSAWVAGNHDWGVLGNLSAIQFTENNTVIGDFASHAWSMILQHRRILNGNANIKTQMQRVAVMASPWPGAYLAHGIFHKDPYRVISTYAVSHDHADQSLEHIEEMLAHLSACPPESTPFPCIASQGWEKPRVMMVGHTHIAKVLQLVRRGNPRLLWADRTMDISTDPAEPTWFESLEEFPLFINPGSVGFPRDAAFVHASYMFIDWEGHRVGVTLRRLAYNPGPTIQAMQDAGMPLHLIRKLFPSSISLGA